MTTLSTAKILILTFLNIPTLSHTSIMYSYVHTYVFSRTHVNRNHNYVRRKTTSQTSTRPFIYRCFVYVCMYEYVYRQHKSYCREFTIKNHHPATMDTHNFVLFLSDVNTNNEFMMDVCAKVTENEGKGRTYIRVCICEYIHMYVYIKNACKRKVGE